MARNSDFLAMNAYLMTEGIGLAESGDLKANYFCGELYNVRKITNKF